MPMYSEFFFLAIIFVAVITFITNDAFGDGGTKYGYLLPT